MALSLAPFPRTGRGSVGSALSLKSQIARRDDSPPAQISPVAGDGTRTGGSHREVPETASLPEALDAHWQSVIDAATD